MFMFNRKHRYEIQKYVPFHFPFHSKMKVNRGVVVVGDSGAVRQCTIIIRQKFIFWLSVTPFKHLKSLRCMDFAVKGVKTILFSDWTSKPHVGDMQFIKFL